MEEDGSVVDRGTGGVARLLVGPVAFFSSRSGASAKGVTGEEDGGPSRGGRRRTVVGVEKMSNSLILQQASKPIRCPTRLNSGPPSVPKLTASSS
jgi:hypothetical protein